MLFLLVKRERLWYTMTMKALLPLTVLLMTLVCLCGCQFSSAQAELPEEDMPVGIAFTLPSSDGKIQEQTFIDVCSSEHAVAYVQAHAVSDDTAGDLLDAFEGTIYPALPLDEGKASILILYMDGLTYGYTPLPVTDQSPMICLNALYPEELAYTLAHEYQHLCAWYACEAGGTALSEGTDELLSDIFCELLYSEHGVLSMERAVAARERIDAWGTDALPYVYDYIRAGYGEEEWLNAMENRE